MATASVEANFAGGGDEMAALIKVMMEADERDDCQTADYCNACVHFADDWYWGK